MPDSRLELGACLSELQRYLEISNPAARWGVHPTVPTTTNVPGQLKLAGTFERYPAMTDFIQALRANGLHVDHLKIEGTRFELLLRSAT